jgi:2',3'-cyclic-nucleotide 2'-phosphodiesterase (5'-nucleotidase family)
MRVRAVGLLLSACAISLTVVAACGDDAGAGASGPGGAAAGGGGAGQGGTAGGVAHVTLFHTSDEHGWLAPDDSSDPETVFGGAAQVMGQLVLAEGYEPGKGLLVSSGDNWTGPAISTWFKGESAVEVFDAMGYQASAVGNHEVDFGLDVLAARAAQASYPYLAANIREVATGERPTYLDAFRIVQVDGVSVGLIGMAGTHTATSADPRITVALTFEDPAETLATVAPEARAAGAELLVVLFHDCDIGQLLVPDGPAVDLVLAGHCHDVKKRKVQGVQIVESGSYFHGYSRIDLDFDRGTGTAGPIEVAYHEVSHLAGAAPEYASDAAIDAIVDGWQAQVDVDLGVEVGTTVSGIPQASWMMSNWITDSWLATHPEADVAVLNFGAMRQSIAAGAFTVEDVFGMLPFDNRLVEIDLTGADLIEELTRACGGVPGCAVGIGGARYVAGTTPVELYVGGAAVDPMATYRVITPDYLYYGGNEYTFATYDDTPVELGENFRDPVIDWTTALGSSVADPVEAHIDPVPRNQ